MGFGTVKFDDLLHRVARRDGLEPGATGALTGAAAAGYAEHLNAAAKYAWLYHPWAETVRTDEVSPAGDPPRYLDPASHRSTTGHYWEEVRGVFREDPETAVHPRPLPFRVLSDGYYITASSPPATVYVAWRAGPPQFTATPHDATATYGTGQVVYLAADGECYRSLADGNTDTPPAASWAAERLPARLQEAVVLMATGGARREDGQDTAAKLVEALADQVLAQEVVRESAREEQFLHAAG